MRSCRRLAVGAAIWLALASVACAGPGVDPDLLTTSGRAGLPSAAGTPLAGALQLGALTVQPEVAEKAGYKLDDLTQALRSAIGKSLVNYGYLAAPTAGTPPLEVTVAVQPLEVAADQQGTTVVAHVEFSSAGSTGAGSSCFPFEAIGRFRALKPEQAGGHQRTIAFLAFVGFAAAGWDASIFMRDQLASANARDAALNARRSVGAGEDISPRSGARDLERFGAINALQLAGGALIAHLGEPGGCNAPAVKAQPVAGDGGPPAEPKAEATLIPAAQITPAGASTTAK